ncbi:hypothetical protein [Rosenbergiella collisarenosi]|uniref:hypothetical protein n=1 Tax=Rosenbergiella collisarenosi TaxID=1544695 RepID=UPI001F4EA2FB|nr:hypothetical protein [Rosenbergiella collisarenosi]
MSKGFDALAPIARNLEQQIWDAAKNDPTTAVEILSILAMQTMLRAEHEGVELEFLGNKVEITVE